ncbi:MAG: hypothetical protein HOY78_47635 [Saccharothrix sp.]|nr:hypothetical protein [Saccharothrix sp.]
MPAKPDNHTRRAIRLARERARQLRHSRVGTEHLLTGLVEVYLSYARPEDQHRAGRLADHLAEHDIEVVGAVHRADHPLVLISPQWTLRDPMPDVEPFTLPTFQLVPELRHETFRADVERLVTALEAV